MESLDFVKAYEWNYRPKTPKRPAWFTAVAWRSADRRNDQRHA